VRLTREEERSVVSIATALEANARVVPQVQEDLFGGPIEVATPYSSYYADLARRVCVRAARRSRP
jgi:hypothetical protein